MIEKEQIYRYMKELVAIPSVSNTEKEQEAARYIAGELSAQPYFVRNPGLTEEYGIEGDYLERTTPYGLVKGSSARTLILTGHYDVVDTEEYGSFREYAYDVEAWKRAQGQELDTLLSMLPEEARKDFETGEWLFGRGVNDMKGGLAIGMALLDWYGQQMLEHPELPGSVLFAAVADEEAYSAGMRGSIPLFAKLREKYGLEYECLIDLEPSFNEEGKQQVYIGSVGKTMPAVLVQGAKAHVVDCFQGLNAVGVLAEMFMRTELAPEFSERFEGEPCPPPTWFNLRDRKEGYDVSVPLRAAGYMSMMGFGKTAGSVMGRLKEIGREAFSSYLNRMGEQMARVMGDEAAEVWAKRSKVNPSQCVLEYGELVHICRQRYGDEAGKWFQALYEKAGTRIRAGEWNYPQATLEIMDEALTYSGITAPVMVISFAPPYYPAFHSDCLPGKEGRGSALYGMLEHAAEESCGIRLGRRNYCCGISDLSYCAGPDPAELHAYAANAPLWGSVYGMDLDAMAGFHVPALLFGPVGEDAHQMSERVHARSLLEEVPVILQNFIEQMFANDIRM